MKKRILIVEDDRDLGMLLRQYLEANHFEATHVFDGKEARAVLKNDQYHLLIVDVMMPNEDGFTFARYVRQSLPRQPFLFVTARNTREDVLHGLKLGADDYITKPFDADELILRINNILRRTWNDHHEEQQNGYHIGCFQFYPADLVLQSSTQKKTLTGKEAALLHYLYENRNKLVSRDEILVRLWGEADFFKGRSMDVFISRLRKYLAEDTSIQIESIRGEGFKFMISE